MTDFFYAQVDANNVCYAVTQTAGEIIQADMLRQDSYDVSLIGKIWKDGVFIPPSPYPSWVLNEDTLIWEAPVVMPDDGQPYQWDEAAQNWVVIPTNQGTTS